MFVFGSCLVSVGLVVGSYLFISGFVLEFISGFASGAHLNSSLSCLSRGSYLDRIGFVI